ncbi:MAG: class II glutamine amidotransferase [Planctomycetota bacterium]
MCGIFGFFSATGRGPDLERLRRIAAVTQERGDHAFGLAWLRDGALDSFKRPGAATDGLADLDRCEGATIVVGHCRWATHGSPADNRNNHPHAAGRGWFVHNGVVRNHEALIRQYALRPRTKCDSEVLGLLMARFGGTLGQRAEAMARRAMGPLAMLGVWKNPGRLLIVRNGNPLCFGESRDGMYFASLPQGLPGRVTPLRDRYVGVLFDDGTAEHHPLEEAGARPRRRV